MIPARSHRLAPLLALLAACGGGASSPGPGPAPVSDGNDTFATAQAIATGSTTAGTISSPTDDDWYAFTTTEAGTVTVTLTGLTADADLALHDSTQALLTGSNNPGTATDALTWSAAAGEAFRAHVIPVSAPADYSLTVTFVAAPPPDGNDTFATAQPVAVGSATAGVISSSTDDDWYRFTTGSAGTVLAMVSALSADADLALVDAGQAVLGTSANPGTEPDVVGWTASGGGTFYAHVIPRVVGATYTLTTGFVPAGIVDGNDTFATATPVALGTILGAISSNTDEDWYTLTTSGAGTITATLDGLMGDADLELYGELSYQLVAGSYFAKTAVDSVTYTANAPIKYHVRVIPRGAVTPYRLTLAFTP